jgi:hypothetical protein
MTLHMRIIESDDNGWTDKRVYLDNPIHIPRMGEFISSDDGPYGIVYRVEWEISRNGEMDMVCVFVKKDEE